MKIQPKREDEVSGGWELLPDGDYPFTVLKSDEVSSKSAKNKGKMMYAIKLNVHGKDGDHHVYDYFADWFSDWKLRHFAATTGMIAAYESGDFDGSLDKFKDKVGYVKITTEKGQGSFGDKNVVKDYVVRNTSTPAQAAAPEETDDSIPF